MVHLDSPEEMAMMDYQEKMVNEDQQDQQEQLAMMADQDPKEHQVLME